MQETAKVNYIQYGKSTKSKKGKKPQSGAGVSGPVEKAAKDLHYCQTLATDVGK